MCGAYALGNLVRRETLMPARAARPSGLLPREGQVKELRLTTFANWSNPLNTILVTIRTIRAAGSQFGLIGRFGHVWANP